MSGRLADGFLFCPSCIESRGDGHPANAVSPRGRRQCHCFSECGKQSVFPRIRALLYLGGPFAVVSAIRAFVVAPLQRMRAARAISHVGIEPGEVLPFWAYRDAAPAVPVIIGTILFLTSASHVDPNSIDRRAVHSMLGINALTDRAGDFACEASAAFRNSSLYIISNDKPLSAALTTA